MLLSEKKPFVCDDITLKRLESYRERYWSDEKKDLRTSKRSNREVRLVLFVVVVKKISLTAPCCHIVKFVEVSKNRAC